MSAGGLRERALRVLEANTQTAELDGRSYRFTVPSVRAYPFQWLWDSCFHAIAWSHFDWRRAADELEGLLAFQDERGFVPHVVFWQPRRVRVLSWHYLESRGLPLLSRPRHTAGIQPPVLAVAAERIVLAGGGDAYAARVVPAIERLHRFLAERRDPDADGLVSVVSQFEAGLDFSPAYDSAFSRWTRDPISVVLTARVPQVLNKLARFDERRVFGRFRHHAEDVLVNTLFAQDLRALARLARRCGRGGLASWADARAAAVTAALLERAFDERRGLFFNLGGREERRSRARTIQCLMPLVLPDLPAEVAARLVEHLTDPRAFWPPSPVPLVALDEPSFTANNRVWGIRLLSRGPATMCVNWLLVAGLRRHGYDDAADQLAGRSIDTVERAGFHEFYDPLSAAPVGARDFGWATLVVDFLSSSSS